MFDIQNKKAKMPSQQMLEMKYNIASTCLLINLRIFCSIKFYMK